MVLLEQTQKKLIFYTIWVILNSTLGEMAEWSKAAVLKTVIPETVSWVRIPLSPP